MEPIYRRTATALDLLTLAAMVLLPCFLVWWALRPDLGEALVAAHPETPVAVVPQVLRLAALIGLAAVGLALHLAVLWQLHRIFRLYLAGRGLSRAMAGRIRASGLLLLVAAVLEVFGHTARILLLTAANPPGEWQLSVGFSSTELSLVLAGGLLLLIGQALGAGALAADENRAFV